MPHHTKTYHIYIYTYTCHTNICTDLQTWNLYACICIHTRVRQEHPYQHFHQLMDYYIQTAICKTVLTYATMFRRKSASQCVLERQMWRRADKSIGALYWLSHGTCMKSRNQNRQGFAILLVSKVAAGMIGIPTVAWQPFCSWHPVQNTNQHALFWHCLEPRPNRQFVLISWSRATWSGKLPDVAPLRANAPGHWWTFPILGSPEVLMQTTPPGDPYAAGSRAERGGARGHGSCQTAQLGPQRGESGQW